MALPATWEQWECEAPTADADRAYEIGTCGRFPSIPFKRRVRISDAPLPDQGGTHPDGLYRMSDRSITIVRHPGLTGRILFSQQLRHEYGHAFVHDFCRSRYGDADSLVMTYLSRIDPNKPSLAKLDHELKPLYEEYRTSPFRFGSYPSSSFNEWLAEAYARHVADKSLPPSTKAFFDKAATMDYPASRCRECH